MAAVYVHIQVMLNKTIYMTLCFMKN